MKKVVFFVTMIAFAVLLCSCSGGITGEEAKTALNEFFTAVESGDYTSAEKYLHPDHTGDLKAFFDSISESKNVEFSDITIEKYTGFSSALYDSSVGGARYELSVRLSLSGKGADAKFAFAKNDNGFGICDMYVRVDD